MNKSTRQIIDLLKDHHGITMSEQNIDTNYRYGKKWKPVINYLRNRYLTNISRIPIANKVYRLALLDEAAREALTYKVDKLYFDKHGDEVGRIEAKHPSIIPAIISEARKEVEGEGSYKGGEGGGDDNRKYFVQVFIGKADSEVANEILTQLSAQHKR